MADVLITGGAGNFGRTLSYELHRQGHALRIFDLPSCDFSFVEQWDQARIFKGDITDPATLKEAVLGADVIFHLAAVLPPASEANRELTFKVNVDGTRNLVEVCKEHNIDSKLVFASSVSVFGDSSQETELIRPGHPGNPNDMYAESKVAAEKILSASSLRYSNLRISGIVVAAFLDPPEPWAFMADQRIELLCLSDLVTALVNLIDQDKAFGRTLILSGGPSWQTYGREYVKRWGNIMEIPFEEMRFMDRPGWLNWYDTSESQDLLKYQNTSMDQFFKELKVVVDGELA